MNIHPDHYETHLATPQESLQEFAIVAGGDNPEKAWLLNDRDIWIANPFYHGPDVPHPESYDYD